MSDFYTVSGTPSTGSAGQSSPIRSEFAAIETAFDKLPEITAHADEFWVNNAGGTAVTTKTASAVRTALGLVIGTNVQAYDANLDQIAALSPTTDNFIIGNGSSWILATASTIRTVLNLIIGNTVQAWSAKLDQIAALTPTADNFIIGNGSAWISATAAATRTSLSLVVGTNVAAAGANSDITSLSGLTTPLSRAQGGTGLTASAPCFSAYQSIQQTVSSSTLTKVSLQAEDFDTQNCFDSVSFYRFQPTVSGFYFIEGAVLFTGTVNTAIAKAWIYKNGAAAKSGDVVHGVAAGKQIGCTVSTLIFLNGSTDYVELYVYQDTGFGQTIQNDSISTHFSGFFALS